MNIEVFAYKSFSKLVFYLMQEYILYISTREL